MSDTPQGSDWERAADGKWYAPGVLASNGWWLAADGVWYPAVSAPGDTPPPPPLPARGAKSPLLLIVAGVVAVVVLLGAALVVLAATSGDSDEAASTSSGDLSQEDEEAVTEPVEELSEDLNVEDTILASIKSVDAFWTAEFAAIAGQEWPGLDPEQVNFYDRTIDPPPCAGEVFNAPNAFWCLPDNFLAFDVGEFMPAVHDQLGPFATSLVVAHEIGHAVGDFAGLTNASSIVFETMADCFAGAWTGAVAESSGGPVELEAADLDVALAGLIAIGDEPGTSAGNDQAHGLAFDRVNAFQEGFEDGAARCAEYPDNPPVFVEFEFSAEELASNDPGDLSPDDALALFPADLNSYWTAVYPDFTGIGEAIPFVAGSADLPVCNGQQVTPEVSETLRAQVCFEEGTVIFDAEVFAGLIQEFGDVAGATLLADQWALAAQVVELGLTEDTLESELQRDCYTGAWLGNLYNFTIGGAELAGRESELSLSPGDLDEAITTMLAIPSASAEQLGIEVTPFQRTDALRDGFFEGPAACEEFTS